MMDIREMKAGRKLDALVAEKVMGLNIKLKGCVEEEVIDQCLFDWDPDVPCPCSYMEKNKTNIGCEHYQPVFKCYSTDISAAWEVREWILENRGGVRLERFCDAETPEYCEVYQGKECKLIQVWATTTPEAICKAALLSKESKS